jgi:predicted Kef-type K+ transport protein
MSVLDDVALPLSLVLAFLLGVGARRLGLPPLVGFLVAGFLLNALGVEGDATIEAIADFGVKLLLFTIGLKLKVEQLAAPAIWAGASLHMAATAAVMTAALVLLAGFAGPTALLLAFALSFCSTVFTVKVFEERGELGARFAKSAIGILIMQDIFAVVFLTASSGKMPSPWAFALLGLIALRPILFRLLDRSGHGELLPLFGLFASIGLGVSLFGAVGLKPDLGALALGMLLAGHPRAGEVAYQLFGFKEILLVGFFLSIGLGGLPSGEQLLIALALLLLLPFKSALFFWLLCRFGLRARAAFLAALSLATHSEFGLIVAGVAVSEGWLGDEWLVTLGVAVALSLVVAAPLNTMNNQLYERLQHWLRRFERQEVLDADELEDAGPVRIAVFGMGRVGTATYDRLRMDWGDVVVGIDADPSVIERHRRDGRRVLLADALDIEWWEQVEREAAYRREHGMTPLEALVLALPSQESNLYVLEKMRQIQFDGLVVAIAFHNDEVAALKAAGADYAFEAFAEAGVGLASHVEERLRPR